MGADASLGRMDAGLLRARGRAVIRCTRVGCLAIDDCSANQSRSSQRCGGLREWRREESDTTQQRIRSDPTKNGGRKGKRTNKKKKAG